MALCGQILVLEHGNGVDTDLPGHGEEIYLSIKELTDHFDENSKSCDGVPEI